MPALKRQVPEKCWPIRLGESGGSVQCPRWHRVPGFNAQPKFVDRCVKVVQFHTDAEGAGCGIAYRRVRFVPRVQNQR